MKPVWDLPLEAHGIDVELHGGQLVRIRPGRPTDREALLAAFERFSDESRYLRFFGGMARLPEGVVDSLTDVDHHERIVWAVFDPAQPSQVGDDSGLAVATARLFVDPLDRSSAEATMAVVDDYQRRGLGHFLLELLVSTADIFGIETLRFEVLSENRGMRRLLGRSGATGTRLPDDPSVIEYRLDLRELADIDPTAGALYEVLRMLADTTRQ